MDIGVARPSVDELKEAPHFFIASHSIHENINAAWYETYALHLLEELFKIHDIVIVTGGTGLYIKALTEGLDFIPEVPEKIRQQVIDGYRQSGTNWLRGQLQLHDPIFAAKGEMKNPQRMMRALEVALGTGQSILTFRAQQKPPRFFQTIKIGLELPRPLLNERINQRVEWMMEAGLEAEARGLWPYRHLNALQTVGYKELFDFFDGRLTLPEAVVQIQQHTRQYAKRQMTWFKAQSEMHWVSAAETEVVVDFVETIRQNKALNNNP